MKKRHSKQIRDKSQKEVSAQANSEVIMKKFIMVLMMATIVAGLPVNAKKVILNDNNDRIIYSRSSQFGQNEYANTEQAGSRVNEAEERAYAEQQRAQMQREAEMRAEEAARAEEMRAEAERQAQMQAEEEQRDNEEQMQANTEYTEEQPQGRKQVYRLDDLEYLQHAVKDQITEARVPFEETKRGQELMEEMRAQARAEQEARAEEMRAEAQRQVQMQVEEAQRQAQRQMYEAERHAAEVAQQTGEAVAISDKPSKYKQEQLKQQAKAEKEAIKAAEKATKKAEKEAKKAEKEARKIAEQSAKEADKAIREAQTNAQTVQSQGIKTISFKKSEREAADYYVLDDNTTSTPAPSYEVEEL